MTTVRSGERVEYTLSIACTNSMRHACTDGQLMSQVGVRVRVIILIEHSFNLLDAGTAEDKDTCSRLPASWQSHQTLPQ